MITVTETVKPDGLHVIWSLQITAPEHERHGQICHAIDGTVMRDDLRRLLRRLGFFIVCSEERPLGDWTEYWTRPAEQPLQPFSEEGPVVRRSLGPAPVPAADAEGRL